MCEVSVITVNKNNGDGLAKTIESVVCQTFTDYEYIVIDGASDDNSIAIINKYIGNIHYWVSESDDGIYHAMNKGIEKATGRYIIFMNSGDCFFSPDTLSKVFSKEQTSDILVGTAIIDGKRLKQRTFVPDKISFYELATHPFCHQAIFTKRTLFEELGGYDESLKISADWKFLLLSVILWNKKINILKQDIAVVQPNGISANKASGEIMKKEREDVLKEYFPYIYTDYIALRKIRRFSYTHIKLYIIWRLRHFLIG